MITASPATGDPRSPYYLHPLERWANLRRLGADYSADRIERHEMADPARLLALRPTRAEFARFRPETLRILASMVQFRARTRPAGHPYTRTDYMLDCYLDVVRELVADAPEAVAS